MPSRSPSLPRALRGASMGHAVLPTLPFDGSCPTWSYRYTGTLTRLISFVSHSCENTGGVGVFFPFWNSLVSCRGFDAGNERLSKSCTNYCHRITDYPSFGLHRPYQGHHHPSFK